MANIIRQPTPTKGPKLALTYLTAGCIGLIAAGLVGTRLHPPTAVAASSLQQARAEFDAGDLPAAASAFKTLADKGDPQAAYWYGYALNEGLGVPVDAREAIAQYDKAWSGGVTQAGTRLGEIYLNGNLIPPQFGKARSYLTDAAQRGDAGAALDLGHMLRAGIGGPADPVKAYAWLEMAALKGNGEARVERNQLLATLSPQQQDAAAQQAASLQAQTTAAPKLDAAKQVPTPPARAG